MSKDEAMKPNDRQVSTIIFGFDSAWAGKQKGAICAIEFDDKGKVGFEPPVCASFADAREFVEQRRDQYAVSLVAIDQPTIVNNERGMRCVEKVAASVISYVGGGVQPANRGKANMFGDEAPVWSFLEALNATEDPQAARRATEGCFLIEVFPALSLTALDPAFEERLGAPKYNPDKKNFSMEGWKAVSRVAGATAKKFGIAGLDRWAFRNAELPYPKKEDQDKLDAALCALTGLIWRSGPPDMSTMIGDLETGYMVTPVSSKTKARLDAAKRKQLRARTPT